MSSTLPPELEASAAKGKTRNRDWRYHGTLRRDLRNFDKVKAIRAGLMNRQDPRVEHFR